jgi:hypothetical protein
MDVFDFCRPAIQAFQRLLHWCPQFHHFAIPLNSHSTTFFLFPDFHLSYSLLIRSPPTHPNAVWQSLSFLVLFSHLWHTLGWSAFRTLFPLFSFWNVRIRASMNEGWIRRLNYLAAQNGLHCFGVSWTLVPISHYVVMSIECRRGTPKFDYSVRWASCFAVAIYNCLQK